MKHRSLAALAVLALSVSCSDGPNEPTLSASGSVAFSYNGGTLISASSYSASGGLPATEAAQSTQQWAAGFRDPEANNNVAIVASVPRATNRFDMAVIAFDRSTPGGSTISVNCTGNACAGLVLMYNWSESTGEVLCGLETGTMTLASVSTSRATGTFSGTGSCILLDDFTTESTFSVTNGTFDVPLLSNVPVAAMIRSQ